MDVIKLAIVFLFSGGILSLGGIWFGAWLYSRASKGESVVPSWPSKVEVVDEAADKQVEARKYF